MSARPHYRASPCPATASAWGAPAPAEARPRALRFCVQLRLHFHFRSRGGQGRQQRRGPRAPGTALPSPVRPAGRGLRGWGRAGPRHPPCAGEAWGPGRGEEENQGAAKWGWGESWGWGSCPRGGRRGWRGPSPARVLVPLFHWERDRGAGLVRLPHALPGLCHFPAGTREPPSALLLEAAFLPAASTGLPSRAK